MKCYCCGEALGSTFALVSYDEIPDRVFLFKVYHVERVDSAATVKYVSTISQEAAMKR